MESPTLLLDGALILLTGLIYAHVGRATYRRHVAGDGQLAARLFGVFWFSLAALQALLATGRILAWAGVLDLPLLVTINDVSLLALCVAFWALDYYLFYILLGTRRLLLPLTLFYAAFYVYLIYIVTVAHPTGVAVGAWSVDLQYESPLTGTIPALVAGILLILPPFIGALGYSRLYFTVKDATQRYRIGLVSVTIAFWMGTALLATASEVGAAPWWQVVSRAVGLAAALLIYAAYRPPGWVRRRWGVQAVEEANR